MDTKAYAIWLSFVIICGFTLMSIVIFHDPVLVKERPKVVYLNLDSLKEAGDSMIGEYQGPAVYKVFSANHQNKPGDTIPWADAYLCHSFNKADSTTGDTLTLLLDTKTDNKLNKMEYPEDYWTADLKKAHRFKKCRIIISSEQLDGIKRAHYKFVSVSLGTDD